MAVQIGRRLFTIDEFEKMISDGILKEDERVELIRGEIIDMGPIKHPHAACVAILEFLLGEKLGRRAYVWGQNPIWFDDRNRPQPDVALLKWRGDFYQRKRPGAEDVLLIIEVADTSLRHDRRDKSTLYAEAGIPEYWIANIKERVVEVFSEPVNGTYQKTWTAKAGDTISLPGDLQAEIDVSEIFDIE